MATMFEYRVILNQEQEKSLKNVMISYDELFTENIEILLGHTLGHKRCKRGNVAVAFGILWRTL
jgi:hypothetical protein